MTVDSHPLTEARETAAGSAALPAMPRILANCLALLAGMHDAERELFSYSTRVVEGRYVNDFDHPLHMRYTINTLLGLQKLGEHYPLQWDSPARIEAFLARHTDAVTNFGDRGLLLYLLARSGHDALPRLQERFAADALLADAQLGQHPVQDLCWMLLGLTACARAGVPDAERRAHSLYQRLSTRHVHPRSLCIRHNLKPVRRDFVSFGAMVYFLKSWAAYAAAFDDDDARQTFKNGVRNLLARQLPDGGWPWFYHVPTGKVMDVYEVYSVHQDAMAMLFLFPARELGVAGIDDATRRSVQWLYGTNDLGQTMISSEPFFIYRSIRRRTGATRGRRFARSVSRGLLGLQAGQIAPAGLEINPECRSYHIGWLLYAWADQPDADAWFTPA